MPEADPFDWSRAPRVSETGPVSSERFHRELKPLETPFVIRGLVSDWPAVAAARTSDEALCRLIDDAAAPVQVEWFVAPSEARGRIGYKHDFSGFNFERRVGPVASLLGAVLAERASFAPRAIYAGALRLRETFPALAAAHPPPFVGAAVDQRQSLWFGNRVQIAAHWDLPRNLICVIAGQRRYVLFPPDQLKNLYVGPVDFTPAGQPMSLVDLLEPDLVAHPRFADARRVATVADLEPGDALYLPAMWWHHAETLSGVGAMINFWWRETPAWMTPPMTTLMHALLTIRDLPEAERTAWRAFFDHYIFQTDGDPMAHLPEAARGAFGVMTPDKAAALRARIVQSLR
ncbi:MAG: cupin-like domain-containing protein [Parvularculaceae bacterium]|nr:cupin-like domain-containing protein [Parvularculaceae bacterium]